MRFLYYDRITDIKRGERVKGVKAFGLSDEFLKGHFGKKALVPGVIFIEAMAQVLGWLVIYSHDFKISPIMSLLGDATVPAGIRPGFTATIRGEIVSTSKRDTLGTATVHDEDGNQIASLGRIIYSHFPSPDPDAMIERFSYYSGIESHKLREGTGG